MSGGRRYEDQSPAAILARIYARCTRNAGGCLIWQGAVSGNGYGAIGVRVGRTPNGNARLVVRPVHRLVLELVSGVPLPPGAQAKHVCDVPRCVNVAHLYRGSAAENTRDMLARGRGVSFQARKTHCLRGHAFDAENTHHYKTWRVCRTCRALHNASTCKAMHNAKQTSGG